MAKKTKKAEYATSPFEPREYVLAWLKAGGLLEETLEFERWITSIRFNNLGLSRPFIREVLGYLYRLNSDGLNDLTLSVLEHQYNRRKSGILSDIELKRFNEAFNAKYSNEEDKQ